MTRDPLFYGMASVIAFGLGIGTVLTLGVTPILYALVFRLRPASTGVPVAATVESPPAPGP